MRTNVIFVGLLVAFASRAQEHTPRRTAAREAVFGDLRDKVSSASRASVRVDGLEVERIAVNHGGSGDRVVLLFRNGATRAFVETNEEAIVFLVRQKGAAPAAMVLATPATTGSRKTLADDVPFDLELFDLGGAVAVKTSKSERSYSPLRKRAYDLEGETAIGLWRECARLAGTNEGALMPLFVASAKAGQAERHAP